MKFVARWPMAPALLAAALAAGTAAAQEDALDAYGTSSQSITTLQSASFLPNASGLGYVDFGASRAANNPATVLETGLSLPSGAIVEKLSLLSCDFNPNVAPTATIYRCPFSFQNCLQVMATVNTGPPSATNGCARYQATPAPFTIDNDNFMYWVEVTNTNGGDGSFGAVQVHWRRQVSAGPATATFNDVPSTHAFYKFVEALAASGITGGCGNGQYCPDAPLTRGQMAVFLATALGLHFPN